MDFIKANKIINNYCDGVKYPLYNKAVLNKAVRIVSDFFNNPDLITFDLSYIDLLTDQLNRVVRGDNR